LFLIENNTKNDGALPPKSADGVQNLLEMVVKIDVGAIILSELRNV
jgi:hypothetical protein